MCVCVCVCVSVFDGLVIKRPCATVPKHQILLSCWICGFVGLFNFCFCILSVYFGCCCHHQFVEQAAHCFRAPLVVSVWTLLAYRLVDVARMDEWYLVQSLVDCGPSIHVNFNRFIYKVRAFDYEFTIVIATPSLFQSCLTLTSWVKIESKILELMPLEVSPFAILSSCPFEWSSLNRAAF